MLRFSKTSTKTSERGFGALLGKGKVGMNKHRHRKGEVRMNQGTGCPMVLLNQMILLIKRRSS